MSVEEPLDSLWPGGLITLVLELVLEYAVPFVKKFIIDPE